MAKIANMKGNPNSNFTQLFGNQELGLLMSRTQAAVISAGTELERHIVELIPDEKFTDLKGVKSPLPNALDVEIMYKPKKPGRGRSRGITADFAIFFHSRQEVYVIELKSGTDFDTQKAPAIQSNLSDILDYICDQTGYGGKFFICSFFTEDPQAIVKGLKGAFSEKEVLTGPRFCAYLGIDFEDVYERFMADQPDNINYFMSVVDEVKAQQNLDPAAYFEQQRKEQAEQLRFHWTGGE